MSIASSIYAEYANEVKDEWVKKLNAINNNPGLDESRKFALLWELINEIDEFKFGE